MTSKVYLVYSGESLISVYIFFKLITDKNQLVC